MKQSILEYETCLFLLDKKCMNGEYIKLLTKCLIRSKTAHLCSTMSSTTTVSFFVYRKHYVNTGSTHKPVPRQTRPSKKRVLTRKNFVKTQLLRVNFVKTSFLRNA